MAISKSVLSVCAKVVAEHIDMDYVNECGGSVSAVYRAEFGYNGLSDNACKNYLQGLPSVCTVPFYNSVILELFEKNGITRKTDSGKYNLIQSYWLGCGKALHQHIRKENENNA